MKSIHYTSRRGSLRSRAADAGFSLIELMVAMIIGLLVLLATAGIFVSNRQTYDATESVGRLQENARVAFEIMARDIRDAGGNPCSKVIPVANVLNNPTTQWWMDFGNGIFGYTNGGLPGSAAGTDAIEVKSGAPTGVTVTDHQPTSAQFKVNTINHGLSDGDVLLVCDYRQAAIFQVTNASPGTNETVVHNSGTGTPGNCSKGLGFRSPMDCSVNGTAYQYGPNSQMVRFQAAQWYIAENGRGTRSLYRRALRGSALQVEEVVEGVQDMDITYLVPGATEYVPAGSVTATQWREVNAVRVVLALRGADRVGTDGQVLRRTLEHVVTLRNRLP